MNNLISKSCVWAFIRHWTPSVYKYQLRPMDPRDAASRPIDHCAVYTQLDAECVINRQQSSVNG